MRGRPSLFHEHVVGVDLDYVLGLRLLVAGEDDEAARTRAQHLAMRPCEPRQPLSRARRPRAITHTRRSRSRYARTAGVARNAQSIAFKLRHHPRVGRRPVRPPLPTVGHECRTGCRARGTEAANRHESRSIRRRLRGLWKPHTRSSRPDTVDHEAFRAHGGPQCPPLSHGSGLRSGMARPAYPAAGRYFVTSCRGAWSSCARSSWAGNAGLQYRCVGARPPRGERPRGGLAF
jgi:hypothetical protein